MAFNKEIMWQTFVKQSQELFTLGYNLPTDLQVKAYEEVQTKLSDWEHALTSKFSNEKSSNIQLVTDNTNIVDVSSTRINPIFTFRTFSDTSLSPLTPVQIEHSVSDSLALGVNSHTSHVTQSEFLTVADGSKLTKDLVDKYSENMLLIEPSNDHAFAQSSYGPAQVSDSIDDKSKLEIDGDEEINTDVVHSLPEDDGSFTEPTEAMDASNTSESPDKGKIDIAPPRRSSRRRKSKRKLDSYVGEDDIKDESDHHQRLDGVENNCPDDDFPNIVQESVHTSESREIIIKMETSELDDSGEAQLVSDIMKEAIEQAAILPDNAEPERKMRRGRGRPRKHPTLADTLFTDLDMEFKCTKCVKSYGSFRVLEAHMETHKETMPAVSAMPCVCPICKKSYNSKGGFDNHIRVHDPDNQVQCPYCEIKCSNYTLMNRHVRLKHEASRPYLCDLCGKGFITPSTLKLHMAIHEGEKKFLCDLCEFRTHTKNILGIHKRNMHSEKGFYTCDLCDARIKYKGSMIEHRRRHLGEKPHPCPTCGSKFTTRSQLAQHVRIHKEKTFTCQVCDKKFINKHKLARHETIHTGEKQYACGFCNYRCNVRGNIRKHWLFVHKMDHDRRMGRVQVLDHKSASPGVNPARPLKVIAPKSRSRRRIKADEQKREILKEQPKNENSGQLSSTKHIQQAKIQGVADDTSKFLQTVPLVTSHMDANTIQTLHLNLPVSEITTKTSDGRTILTEYSFIQSPTVQESSSSVGTENNIDEKTIEIPIETENLTDDLAPLTRVVPEEEYSTGVETKVQVSEDGTLVYLYFQDTDGSRSVVESCPPVASNEYVVSMDATETQQEALNVDQML